MWRVIICFDFRSKIRDIRLVTSETKAKKPTKSEENKKGKNEDSKKKNIKTKEDMRHKYEQYFSSDLLVCNIKPHQVLIFLLVILFDLGNDL